MQAVPTSIWFRRGLIASIAALAGMIILAKGCRLIGLYSWTWNQKVELRVVTPDGEVSGWSVVQASYSFWPEWYGMGDFHGAR
jgi:hypothetical protein